MRHGDWRWLRKVVSIREGTVRLRTREGYAYNGPGYAEVLECGHEYVPYNNTRFGGQDDPKEVGRKRRCDECMPCSEPLGASPGATPEPIPLWLALNAESPAKEERQGDR